MDRSMDRPIFIHASHTDSIGGKSPQFYVIEEQGLKISGNSLQNDDLMRRLNVPNLDEDIWFSSLVAANSCLYVIGARRKVSIGGGGSWYTYEPVDGYMVLDLGKKDQEWRWQHDGDFLNSKHHGAMACEDDGSIYTFGGDRNYHVLDGGVTENIPLLPDDLGRVPNLLWVSNKKVLGYTDGRGRCLGANLLVSYDLESGGGKWETLNEKPFWGLWSKGVLLFDRYLFSFGLGHPYDFGRSWTTNVYVFDIEERQWLPEPVDGLPNDGTVLPEIQTEQDYPPLHVKPHLFLIGWEQGLPKLALVWASYYTQVCVHCTKFIINPDDTTSSLFKATIVSTGSHKLGNDTTFISCTAPVMTKKKSNGVQDEFGEVD